MKTQTVVNWRRLGKTVCAGAVLACTALALPSSSALAANRIFNFYVVNIDSRPVKVTLTQKNNCYQGSMPEGQRTTIAPGGNMVITIARVQGHGCDGEAGQFTLEFDPAVDGNKNVSFSFSNDGGMWLDNIANPYPGKLGPKNPINEIYVYTTVPSIVAPPVTPISKARGSWSLVGQGIVNRTVKYEVTNQTSTDRTVSSETKHAISAALEVGVELGPFSAKATVSATEEKSIGHSMSQGLMHSITESTEVTISLTRDEMDDRDLFAIWQWVAEIDMSDGSRMLVKTNMVTGTPGPNPPTYLPGSPQDIVSLKKNKSLPVASIGLPSSSAASTPATAPPAAVPPAAASPGLPANVLNGAYVNGGTSVGFRLTLTTNAPTFTGVIQENYAGFGTPATDGLLYADVVGNVLKLGDGRTIVRFQKRYKFFDSPIVSYECAMDPTTGNLSGTWSAPGLGGGNAVLQPQR